MEFNLNIYETMALVSLVFYMGKYIRNKFSILSKYCIPPSVVGGFIFAILILILKLTNIATINLDTTLQELFMTAFFTSIGFTASLKILKQGGIKVVSFLGLAVLLVISHSTIPPEEVGDYNEENTNILSLKRLITGSSFLFIAMGFGSIISDFIQKTGLTFPSYIGAMLAAAIIRNIYDFTGKEVVEKEIETLGSLSLSFFLTMALMGLKLWQLFDLALPLMVMLIAQVLLVGLFAYIVTYRVMGKNYEAVVFASATCGFGMGATPNAIANMDELTNRYGFVHTPYFVVPIVGCLFIDFVNSAIITMFINFIS